MSNVKNQRGRGTCSVFATVALLEAAREEVYSEQCLAWDSSNEDAGHARQRLEYATAWGINLDADCPYAEQRDATPDPVWRARRRHVLGGHVYRRYYSARNGEDPVDFLRDMVTQGFAVAVGVLVVGHWWWDKVYIPDCLYSSRLEVEAACRFEQAYCDGPTFAADHVPNAIERDQLATAFRYCNTDAGMHVDFSSRANGQWVHHSFPEWLELMRPIDVPNDAEIRATCGGKKHALESKKKQCARHALVITAFDDRTQTLEFKNSWGREWKNGGYGRMTYAYLRRFHTATSGASAFVVWVPPERWRR